MFTLDFLIRSLDTLTVINNYLLFQVQIPYDFLQRFYLIFLSVNELTLIHDRLIFLLELLIIDSNYLFKVLFLITQLVKCFLSILELTLILLDCLWLNVLLILLGLSFIVLYLLQTLL